MFFSIVLWDVSRAYSFSETMNSNPGSRMQEAQEEAFTRSLRLIQTKNQALLMETAQEAEAGRRASVSALAVLSANNPQADISSLYGALQSSWTGRTNFNLLYGTSIPSSGTMSEENKTVLFGVVNQPDYNQASFLTHLNKTADLYRALIKNHYTRASFNASYIAKLKSAGSPVSKDRDTLFAITAASTYSQWSFLQKFAVPVKPLFGPSSFWNTPLASNQTIHWNSKNFVNELVANTKLAGPWINTTKYSTPVYVVNAKIPLLSVKIIENGVEKSSTVLYAEALKGIPVPEDAVPAAGSDGVITIYDKTTDTLYEFWRMKKVDGKWEAAWGGILKNASTSNGIMPTVINSKGGQEKWGATATGLPAAGGIMMLHELMSGKISHALEFAIPRPKQSQFVWPAQRTDGFYTGPNAIPEGARFRFASTIVIDPNWSPIIKMMVTAVRDFGMVLRDRSGSVGFAAEDPTQYGFSSDPYTQFYGGKALWDVMKQFPWDKLQTLSW